MKIRQNIEQRQQQTIAMTPQLRQAIKLLQLSSQELEQYLNTEIENNPFLERGEERAVSVEEEITNPLSELSSCDYENVWDEPDAPKAVEANEGSDLIYQSSRISVESKSYLDTTHSKKPLRTFLLEQLNIAAKKPYHKTIGSYLIDNLDISGYIEVDVAKAAQDLKATHREVEDTLQLIQGFEPAGIGARTLRECLALQLKDSNELTPSMQKLIENLDLLAQAEYSKLAKIAGLTWDECREAINRIRMLNPKPALAYHHDLEEILIPDVIMRRNGDRSWLIELNADAQPRVLLNYEYYNEIKAVVTGSSSEVFVQNNMRHASWLIKALQQRAETLIKVSQEIVKFQQDFFENGEESLRPMGLKLIASALGIHESTVSRVTTNKYIATPLGIYELKYFFSSTLANTEDEEDHASKAVQQRIRLLINSEDKIRPFSDEQLAIILKAEGICVARRTITKYRERLNIASSVDRRRHYRLQDVGL